MDQVDSRDSLHATSSHNRLFTAVQAVISELKRKSGENYETPKDTFLFSRKFDEKHVTKLRNIEDDIFVEDIELVNIETSSEHRRDSKKYETPLEDVDENDPVVDINETPYSMEELSIGGMIQGMSRSYELAKNRNNITDQENNCCLQAGTWILQIVNKYLKNSLISLFF